MMILLGVQSVLLIFYTLLFELCSSVYAANDEKPLQPKKAVEKVKSYAPGDHIVVECLNRTT